MVSQEFIAFWQRHISSIDYHALIKNTVPRISGCGLIYELKHSFNDTNVSLAITDMRFVHYAEPHYHPIETEIYIVLRGSGLIVVGNKEHIAQKDSVVVIPPDTAHFTIPETNLMLAVVNIPAFNPENYIPLLQNNSEVNFDLDQFMRLTYKHTKRMPNI